ETVDDDDARAVFLDAALHVRSEFARRQFRWIDLLKANDPGLECLIERQAEHARPRFQRASAFVEREVHRMLAALRRRDQIGQRERRLADARGPEQQSVGPALEASP